MYKENFVLRVIMYNIRKTFLLNTSSLKIILQTDVLLSDKEY